MNWKTIGDAPRDGTLILLANATHFCGGYLAFRVEDAMTWLGYGEGLKTPQGWPMIGPRFAERIPNPNAGKRHEWWQTDNPVAFRADDQLFPDYEGGFPLFEPTHWAPMLEAPNVISAPR